MGIHLLYITSWIANNSKLLLANKQNIHDVET